MYQCFLMDPAPLYCDEEGEPRTGTSGVKKQVQLLWENVNRISFGVQQGHRMTVAGAYVGLGISTGGLHHDPGPPLECLFDVDFVDLNKVEGNLPGVGYKYNAFDGDSNIEKLFSAMRDFLSTHEEVMNGPSIIVVLEYPHSQKDMISDEYNRTISFYSDLCFSTVCYDLGLEQYVYQSYACGEYDEGYYSSAEEFRKAYVLGADSTVGGETYPLIRLHGEQAYIKETIDKFNS